MRGFYTNPSRADDCFIPFKHGAEWNEATNSNGVVNTIDIGYKPTIVIAIKRNSALAGSIAIYKNESIEKLDLGGANTTNLVTLTITETGFTYKQTFTSSSYPLEYLAF